MKKRNTAREGVTLPFPLYIYIYRYRYRYTYVSLVRLQMKFELYRRENDRIVLRPSNFERSFENLFRSIMRIKGLRIDT